MIRRLALLLVLVALIAPPAFAEDGATAANAIAAGAPAPAAETANYIVRLANPSLAAYTGGIRDLAATSPQITGARKLDVQGPAAGRYLAFLAEKRAEFVQRATERLARPPALLRTYELVFNGVALALTEDEAALVAQLPGVEAVEREQIFQLDTDRGPSWIGAAGPWGAAGGCAPGGFCGEGVIVGILDSGVNTDHPSFAATGEDGYTHTNPYGAGVYKGQCATGLLTCNAKLIGVRGYTGEASGEDGDGHGSHTASTAAGNRLYNKTLTGPTIDFTFDQISGVAPHANVIAYDVCDDAGCSTLDTLSALDDAAADGVDVVNYSISGSTTISPWDDNVELAFRDARFANIFVSASAGNSGPGPATLAHGSPWLTTVAASTHDRAFTNAVTGLTSSGGALADIEGRSMTAGYGPAAIVYAGDYGNPLCDATATESFPPGAFDGEIVVCDRGVNARVDKAINVQAAGGGGMILANAASNGDEEIGDAYVIPGVHITYAEGVTLKAWLATGANHAGSIRGTIKDIGAGYGDVMAAFSSRGPNGPSIDILKPDVTAPGADVLAAVATIPGSGKPAPEFDLYSGTSMSSPHTAGAGALMIDAHPDWTIAEIQSALMMTAYDGNSVRKENGVDPTDPFDRGAGRVNLANAVNAGLVMNVTLAQYQAADPTTTSPGDPKTLNLPSMADDACGTCSWSRTVRNPTSQSMTWTGEFVSADGLSGTLSPGSFTLAPGATATFQLTVSGAAMPAGQWYFGRVVWRETGGKAPDAHMPVAVRPAGSTNGFMAAKSANVRGVEPGGRATFTIDVFNTTTGTPTYSVSDPVPPNSAYVAGSANGLTFNSGTNTLTASGTLTAGALGVQPMRLSGYQSLAAKGDTASAAPSNADEGCTLVTGMNYTFNGTTYTRALWSVNGTLMPTTNSTTCATKNNTTLPASASPNNLIAPFWADLDLTSGGAWYFMTVAWDGKNYTVFEWEDVPVKGTSETATFQVWIEQGGSRIWFAYPPGGLPAGSPTATVGVENSTGTAGGQYYHNGTGTLPDGSIDLFAGTVSKKSLTFQADATGAAGSLVLNQAGVTVSATTAQAVASVYVCGPAQAASVDVAIQGRFYALLDWTGTGAGGSTYEVWRSTQPYIAPGAGDSLKVSSGSELLFVDKAAPVVGDPLVNHFYTVRTLNCAGTSTADSAGVAEFDFALTPGQ